MWLRLMVWLLLGVALFLAGCTFHLGAEKLGIDWTIDRAGAPAPVAPG